MPSVSITLIGAPYSLLGEGMSRLRIFERDYACRKKVILYTYNSGNSCGNLYFIWMVPEDESESDLLTQSQAVV